MIKEVFCPKCGSTDIRREQKRCGLVEHVSMDDLPQEKHARLMMHWTDYTSYTATCKKCGYVKAWSDLGSRA